MVSFGVNLHAIRDQRATREDKVFLTFNLDETQSTAFKLPLRKVTRDLLSATVNGFYRFSLAGWWQVGMVADGWYVNVYFSCCFKDGCGFFNLNLSVVYEEF